MLGLLNEAVSHAMLQSSCS